MSARVYGNWRRPVSAGLWGFSTLYLVVLMGGAVVAAMVVERRGLLAGVCVGLVTAVVVLPTRFADRYGRHLWQRATAAVAWHWGRSHGQHLYASGPLARIGHGTHALPGLAAGVDAYEAFDGLRRPFALLHHRSVDHVTAVIEAPADGAALLDDEEIDGRVAAWGDWLAALGYEPGFVGASVTMEAAPDGGSRLRREIEGHVAGDAPGFARAVMGEIADLYPEGSASVTCRIALTWSMAARGRRGRRSVQELAVDVGHRLPQLTRTLSGTGVGPGRPLSVSELACAVRVAYEPGVHRWVEGGGEDVASVEWRECGPRFSEEHAGHLFHDGAYSVSWEMGQAPRGMVLSSVLVPLLQPHPKLARKRVTLLFRPHDPATSATVVERDFRDAMFNGTNAKGLGARSQLAVQQAERTAAEEARGAGLTRFALVVTATVTEKDDVDEATAVVEDLGLACRMALRRAWGSQAATFACGLPLGLVVPAHLRVAESLRELA